MYVNVSYQYIALRGQEKAMGSLEWELQIVVRLCVDAGNRTQILSENGACS